MFPQTQIVFPGSLTPDAPADTYAGIGKRKCVRLLARLTKDPSRGREAALNGPEVSFSAVVIGSGLTAWANLKKSAVTQQQLMAQSAQVERATTYFLENAGSITSSLDITEDFRLMQVSLGAFGLSEDSASKYFIKRIMDEGVASSDALANKLSDRRYRLLAANFDFSNSIFPGLSADSTQGVVDRFVREQFEKSVGETDNSLRLSLNFSRTISEISASSSSDAAAWYQVLGTPPTREVIAKALGLPDQFFNLDIDDQVTRMSERAESRFGTSSIRDLSGPELSDLIIESYLLQEQINQTNMKSPKCSSWPQTMGWTSWPSKRPRSMITKMVRS